MQLRTYLISLGFAGALCGVSATLFLPRAAAPARRPVAQAASPDPPAPRVAPGPGGTQGSPDSLAPGPELALNADLELEASLEPEARGLHETVAALPALEAYAKLYEAAADDAAVSSLKDEFARIAEDRGLEPNLRSLGIWGLARAGDSARIAAFLDPSEPQQIRLSALEMLRRHAPDSARGLLARLASADRDPGVREAALRSLWQLNPDASLDHVLSAAEGDEPSLRVAAVELLGGVASSKSLKALVTHAPASEKEAISRIKSLWALRAVDRAEAASALRSASGDAAFSGSSRDAARTLAAQVNDPRAEERCGQIE